MSSPSARFRLVVSEWFTVLVALLLVVTLVGGWLTYTGYVDPGTHVEQRTDTVAEYAGGYAYRANVTRANPVFERGTTLSNRSVYFTSIAPVLDGTFTYRYRAPEGGSVDVRAALHLVVRSVDTGENSTEYWRVSRTLDNASEDGVAPGTPVRLRFSQNVSALSERVGAIEESLGNPPGRLQVRLVADVRATGTAGARSVNLSHRYPLRLQLEEDTYRIADPGPETSSATVTREVDVPNTPGPLRRVGGPALAGLAGLGLVGLLAARSRGDLDVTDADNERLTYRSHRREFDEWITTASVPDQLLDVPVVEVDSLEGLVDVAIDTNARVIEDAARNRYVVPGGDVAYVYTPPGTALVGDDGAA